MTVLDELPATDGRNAAGSRPAVCRVSLSGGRGEVVYRRQGRWAVTWGGVRARDGRGEFALSEYLDVLHRRRLRPMFVGVANPTPYTRRALYTHPFGREAVLALPSEGIAAANPQLRRDLEAADRAGLQMLPYSPLHGGQVARLTPSVGVIGPGAEAWVAVNGRGAVRGVAVWVPGVGISGARAEDVDPAAVRRLRRVAVHPGALRGVVELLIADAADEYHGRGVRALHLGWRPTTCWWPAPQTATPSFGPSVLPLFRPRWEARWLAIPSGWRLPSAAWALR